VNLLRFIVAAMLALSAQTAFAADQSHWTGIARTIAAEIAKAETLALSGKTAEAKKLVTQAYFGLFESEKMEAAMRKELGSKSAYEREKQFGDLRKLIGAGAAADIQGLSAALRTGLAEDGAALDRAGIPPEVFQVNQ
jgi:hypothetical protein